MVKASIEFCGAHFTDKLNRKRKKYLGKDYGDPNQPDVTLWVDKIYAIRFDEPATMEETMNSYLDEARELFNRNKRGNGKKGSLFYRCRKFWLFVKTTYVNGTHATAEALSCINRPSRRSNQELEACQKYKNQQVRVISNGEKKQGKHWLRVSARLEKRSMNRIWRINETGSFKKVRSEKKIRDKSYATVIREYKSGSIDHDEYVRKIVKLRRIHELPKTKKALLRKLEKSESDSDSE